MEAVIKVENFDDEEFENISMEDTQLAEMLLPFNASWVLKNGLEGRLSEVEEDETLTFSDNINSDLLLSEAEQPTLTVKSSTTNDAESASTFQNHRLICSPPFFKTMQQLGPNKDILILRCCSCGRLMRCRDKCTSNILEHIKEYHPEVAKLYEKNKLENFEKLVGKIKNLDVTNYTVSTTNNNSSIADKATSDIMENDNNSKEDMARIEIVDGDAEVKTNDTELVQQESVLGPVGKEPSAELSEENLKKLEVIINEKLQQLIQDTGFRKLNDKVNDLFKIKNTNDTESNAIIKKLQSEVYYLQRECNSLRSAVSESQKIKRELQNKLKKLENHLQQRKLVIKNMKISNREQPLKEVQNFFKESLGLSNVSILSCNIITPNNPISNSSNILVELSNAEDCKLALRKIRRLRTDNVFIEPKLSPKERKCRNKLMIVRRELLSRNSNLKVYVRNTMLLIKDRRFYWDDKNGLCHNIPITPDNSETTCAEHLENLTGINLKEFLDVLQKYDVE